VGGKLGQIVLSISLGSTSTHFLERECKNIFPQDAGVPSYATVYCSLFNKLAY